MTSNYYYLVAGLPELLLDEGKQQLSTVDFIAEASEQLTPADMRLFNYLRLPFDNDNLLALLLKSGKPFDKRGSFEEDELAAALKVPDSLPDYLQRFLEAHRENRPPAPGLTPPDQLAWFFYEEMTAKTDPFIGEWYTFDSNLRNVIAGVNCRKGLDHLEDLSTDREKAAFAVVIGRDEVAEAILRSNAPDFGLSAVFPWADRIINLSRGPLNEFEKGIDTLRWDILNDLTLMSYFRAETVFAFFIKLTIVERWLALDPETGREHLDRLLDELSASYTVPANF
jgi:hypothetical protein